jgi:diacylglycerol kinase
MNEIIKSILRSFHYAFEGLGFAIRTQRNIRIHLLIGFIIFISAIVLKCSLIEIGLLLITISLVISLEMINTAIEEIINMISPHSQPKAKIVKDIGAATVLISAISAVVLGLLIIGPKLLILFIK